MYAYVSSGTLKSLQITENFELLVSELPRFCCAGFE